MKNYTVHSFFDSAERRKEILKKSTDYLVQEGAICGQDQTNVIDRMLRLYGKPYVSLVELIYRTLFELKKVSSKPGSIQLDWDEWGNFIRGEFYTDESNTQLYGIIAALKVFNMPITVSLFCRFFEIKERTFGSRLKERFVHRHVEPVIYQEGSKTLQPKHDVIAELFFLFHRETVSINSFVCDLLKAMNEDEIELFLANMVNKKEVLKSEKHLIGKIAYWDYMQLIYDRIQSGTCNLSQDARTYLCMGILWAGSQHHIVFNTVESMVQDIAPEIDDSLLCRKFYNEWGIWYAKNKHDKLAEEKFLTVIAHDKQQIPARTELGRLLSRQKGREGEAEQFLREAIRIDPKNLHPHTELGRLLSRQKGREGEAEQFLREILTIDPRNLHTRAVLAQLYEKLDRTPEARELYRELCEIDPGNRFGREGLARLKP